MKRHENASSKKRASPGRSFRRGQDARTLPTTAGRAFRHRKKRPIRSGPSAQGRQTPPTPPHRPAPGARPPRPPLVRFPREPAPGGGPTAPVPPPTTTPPPSATPPRPTGPDPTPTPPQGASIQDGSIASRRFLFQHTHNGPFCCGRPRSKWPAPPATPQAGHQQQWRVMFWHRMVAVVLGFWEIPPRREAPAASFPATQKRNARSPEKLASGDGPVPRQRLLEGRRSPAARRSKAGGSARKFGGEDGSPLHQEAL